MNLSLCTLRPWFSKCPFPFKCCKSAFSQHQTSEAKRNPNASKLCTALFSSAQWHEARGGNCLSEDKDEDGSLTWARCGATLLHPARGGGNICQRLTEDTKSGGLCHRSDGWVPAERPWLLSCGAGCPLYPQGDPGHSLYCGLLFPAGPGIRKSVLSPNMLLQTWAWGLLFCSSGAVGVAALPAAMGWARTTTGWRFCLGRPSWRFEPSAPLPASCLCSLQSLTHTLKTSGLDSPKVFLNAFLTFLSIL